MNKARPTPRENWAITWAPNPDLYRSLQPIDQWRTCLTYLRIAKRFSDNFYFVPELTANGNIHVHGIFEIRDAVAYFRKFLPMLKKQGFIKIKKVDDYHVWMAYISKEQLFMQNLFGGNIPCSYDQDCKFPITVKPKYTLSKKTLWKKGDINKYFK